MKRTHILDTKGQHQPNDIVKTLFSTEEKVDELVLKAQQSGLAFVLTAVITNTPLSVELIKNIHRNIATRELGIGIGNFRDTTIMLPIDTMSNMTEKGISEIIDIMISESNFPKLCGTCLFSLKSGDQPDFSFAYYHGKENLHKKEKLDEKKTFVFKLISMEIQKKQWVLAFPSTTNSNAKIHETGRFDEGTVAEFMLKTTKEILKTYTSEIKQYKKNDDKINLIVKTIKQLLRFYIFPIANHRALVLGLLNFLLLKEGIGFCVLANRRQFILNGLEESITAVKQNMIYFNSPEETIKFCVELIDKLDDQIEQSSPGKIAKENPLKSNSILAFATILHSIKYDYKTSARQWQRIKPLVELNLSVKGCSPNKLLPIRVTEKAISLCDLSDHLNTEQQQYEPTQNHQFQRLIYIPLQLETNSWGSLMLYINKNNQLRSVCMIAIEKADTTIIATLFTQLKSVYQTFSGSIKQYSDKSLGTQGISISHILSLHLSKMIQRAYFGKYDTQLTFIASHSHIATNLPQQDLGFDFLSNLRL